MRKEMTTCTVIVVIVATSLFPTLDGFASAQQLKASEVTHKDEPRARALYKEMIETIRFAKTLSYESRLQEEDNGEKWDPVTYRVWMKKPNYFYVETVFKDGVNHGILVGDGQTAWSYWPNGRPWFSGEEHEVYQKSRLNVYMKEPAPPGNYSIGYSKIMIKSNCFPVLNPSVFLGIHDSLEPHIEWMRCLSVEKIEHEACDVIEVSFMDRKRSYIFWISKRDHLPRKLNDIVRTNGEHITQEIWSKVTLNADIPAEKFKWTPPDGWRQWHPPAPEDRLLKPGREAPDFEFPSVEGNKIKLSDFRGNVVWLTFWRVGCPPCREQIPYLEQLYQKYKSYGLIILGFDFADNRQIAVDFLKQHSATFPNIADTSEEAIKTGFIEYQARAAPVNYFIDREGKIAAAWLGHDPNDPHITDTLTKLGIQ